MLERAELMQLLQPAAAHLLPPVPLWHRPRTTAVRGCACGLQRLVAPPLYTPLEVQHTRTEFVLKTDFLQAPEDAPLAF